jgi:hypothetical protein
VGAPFTSPTSVTRSRLGLHSNSFRRSIDAACVESIRYLMKGCSARALYLTDDRKHISRMTISKSLDRRCGCDARFT